MYLLFIARLHAVGRVCWRLSLLAIVAIAGPAHAQYKYDPNNPDEIGKGARYFGAVKDDRGRVVEGATVVVQSAYIFMSDHEGRFAGYAPSDLPPKTVAIGCTKPGYSASRIVRRSGASGNRVWVQADCVLRRGGT